MNNYPILLVYLVVISLLSACDNAQLNNPYSKTSATEKILYSSFRERPKHLDPAVAYSSNEYSLIAQIYQPPLQYHYLQRPYTLIPLTASELPQVNYLNAQGEILNADAEPQEIAISEYIVTIKSGIKYQPHPAFALDKSGNLQYHQLSSEQLTDVYTLFDLANTGTRELTAADYVYQIKRLAHPKIHSPIAEIMKQKIVGFANLAEHLLDKPITATKNLHLSGVKVLSRYQYKIQLKGKYPQFSFWLAMPFFAAMPWEADVFYAQAGLIQRNITLDWFPIGTGAYFLAENNPNRRMILDKNPNFYPEKYPVTGMADDVNNGLLQDAGKVMPFIDKVIFTLEKETIPYWNKFLQGYYDASGIASDSFDQAIQFSGNGNAQLTPQLKSKGVQLQTAVATSINYLGFNMLDKIVGANSDTARKLRQAISIAIDYEEYIAIFANGRGIPAQGILPPEIFGFASGDAGINQVLYNPDSTRKNIALAQQLLLEAGYPNGVDAKTGEALMLYFDTPATGADDRPRMNWFRKQFQKLGINLVIRATDYNRFQEKMRLGKAQIFTWGWNADYPDPENFLFLLYGANGKVKHGGVNTANYNNPEYDRLFELMRDMENTSERYAIIQQMQAIIHLDAPWVFGLHPKIFELSHQWYKNIKPNLMANNSLKYKRIEPQLREQKRQEWNPAHWWPLIFILLLIFMLFIPAMLQYKRRLNAKI